jgi:hypothetical protein
MLIMTADKVKKRYRNSVLEMKKNNQIVILQFISHPLFSTNPHKPYQSYFLPLLYALIHFDHKMKRKQALFTKTHYPNTDNKTSRKHLIHLSTVIHFDRIRRMYQ